MRFDEIRGYGFIAPDAGGDDVFIHANVLECEKSALAPGVPVRYEAVDSDRGPKATTVQVLRSGLAEPRPAESRPPVSVPTKPANGSGNVVPHPPRSVSATGAEDEDAMCDVLSERALLAEITESLLATVGDLSAAQVIAVRSQVLGMARNHGWVEG